MLNNSATARRPTATARVVMIPVGDDSPVWVNVKGTYLEGFIENPLVSKVKIRIKILKWNHNNAYMCSEIETNRGQCKHENREQWRNCFFTCAWWVCPKPALSRPVFTQHIPHQLSEHGQRVRVQPIAPWHRVWVGLMPGVIAEMQPQRIGPGDLLGFTQWHSILTIAVLDGCQIFIKLARKTGMHFNG